MKKFFSSFNAARLKQAASWVWQKTKKRYQQARYGFLKLNRRQHITFCFLAGVLVLMGFIFVLSFGTALKADKQTSYPVQFETKQPLPPKAIGLAQSTQHKMQLQTQLQQIKSDSRAQYQVMQHQLQAIKWHMNSLASSRAITQLQRQVTEPTSALINKVNKLQSSVKQLVQQTKKKVWVPAKQVTRYFQLVAIQGFSDGMRAIITVNGNQTTLEANEVCPACRGWVLKSMNFPEQSAVFSKQSKDNTLYAKLTVN